MLDGVALSREGAAQIAELRGLLAGADEEALGRACVGREKLGDGTVTACAAHTIRNYGRVLELAGVSGAPGTPSGRDQLLVALDAVAASFAGLASLPEASLQAVSAPSEGMRFADGSRTVAEIVAAALKHQRHQVAAIGASLS